MHTEVVEVDLSLGDLGLAIGVGEDLVGELTRLHDELHRPGGHRDAMLGHHGDGHDLVAGAPPVR